MLITSRETQRWVIPKGNLMKALQRHEAAAQEAYEEAGLLGIPFPTAIGAYPYVKRRPDGSERKMNVDVYPFSVTGRADSWPEQGERDTAWFAPKEAAEMVDEPELKVLLRKFRPPKSAKGLSLFPPRLRRTRRAPPAA